jgi:hypothetical protein
MNSPMRPLIQIHNYADQQRQIRAERRVTRFIHTLYWLASVLCAAALINALTH